MMDSAEAQQLRAGERIICEGLRGTVTINQLGQIGVTWDNGERRAYAYGECVFFESLVFKPSRLSITTKV